MADTRETLKQILIKAAIDGFSNFLSEVAKSRFAFLFKIAKSDFAFLSNITKFDNSSSRLLFYQSFAYFSIVTACLMIIYFSRGRQIIEQILQSTIDTIKLKITTDNPKPTTADHALQNMLENAEHGA